MQSGRDTLSGRAAAWVSALDLDDVPDAVLHAARRCMVDLIGVTLAGAGVAPCDRIAAHARDTHAPGRCTVFGHTGGLAPTGAALANGAAGHVLDFDDTSYTGIMHGSTVVFPAALAAVEHAQGDGRSLTEAFIAGVELTYAIAMLCNTGHYFKGWWSTATFGIFGAAAAAARGLGLDAGQTQAALAIAGIQASGLKAAFGTDAKPYMAGRAAASGVEAALLAARGMSGPAGVLEDSRGFLALLNDGNQETGALDHLGRIWRLADPGILFKQFPVCSAAHAATELVTTLVGNHAIRAADVREVVCEVTPTVAISLVHDRPATPQEAQFSLPFAVGAILAHGRLDIDSLKPDVLADPALRREMAKVVMVRDDTLHADNAPEGARVTIHLHNGKVVSDYLGIPSGMPANPMSDPDLRRKFMRCCEAGGLTQATADALHAQLDRIESVAAPLANALAGAAPQRVDA